MFANCRIQTPEWNADKLCSFLKGKFYVWQVTETTPAPAKEDTVDGKAEVEAEAAKEETSEEAPAAEAAPAEEKPAEVAAEA